MAATVGANEERRLLQVEAGGSTVESVAGFGVIVLSILGLIGVSPMFLTAIAGILFGVGLLSQGAAIGSEFSSLYAKVTQGTLGEVELGGGMTAEFLAGTATVALGILALVGQSPEVLLPVLAITAGTALMLTTGAMQRLNTLKLDGASAADVSQRVARYAVEGVVGSQFLAGIGAVVLGIVALAYSPATVAASGAWLTLTLVALLVLGGAVALSGGALAGRLMQMFGQRR